MMPLKIAIKAGKTPAKNNGALNDQEIFILNLRLDQMDQYDEAPTWKTKLRTFAFRLYKVINSGQTGIFVARSLFLAGAALAGICALFGPGAPIAFIAIAVGLAVVAIVFKLTRLYLQEKEAEKKRFVETFPDRISDLKKQYKKLLTVQQVLNQNSQGSLTRSLAGTSCVTNSNGLTNGHLRRRDSKRSLFGTNRRRSNAQRQMRRETSFPTLTG